MKWISTTWRVEHKHKFYTIKKVTTIGYNGSLSVKEDNEETVIIPLQINDPFEALRIYLVAQAFSRGLRAFLDEDQMEAINRKNMHNPEYKECCATHDYCDANVVMLNAFESALGTEFDPRQQYHADLANAAWELAKIHRFKL